MPGTAILGFCQRRERLLVLAALVLGAVWRAVWVVTHGPMDSSRFEPHNVAMAFARTGVLADAYGPGQGPTAHVGPIMPVYEGLIYRVLGAGDAAEAMLVAITILFALASFYFLYLCMKALGTPLIYRLAGLFTVCLAPLNASLELRELRYFEGLLATALTAGFLFVILKLDRRSALSVATVAGLGLGVAILCMINPASALACYGALGILILRRSRWRQWPAFALVLTITLAAVLAPWAMRNERALGHAVLLRSNFGIELAQAYHPAAVAPADPRATFIARHETVHPLANPVAFAAVKAQGEVEYAQGLEREAKAWIASDPSGAARIAVRAFRQFWLPDPWLYAPWATELSKTNVLKAVLAWVLTLAGLGALAAGLLHRNWIYLYIAPALILPSLPYVMVQPVMRYRYLVSSLLIFLAFDGLRRLAEAAASRQGRGATAPDPARP